jgi:hypothetical protein
MKIDKYLIGCVTIWIVLISCGFAFGEELPKDTEKPEQPFTGEMFRLHKPVSCTNDSYEAVKGKLLSSHGEVGVVRWISAEGTIIEILANPISGSSTLLEYHPPSMTTCVLSSGTGAEYNTNIFKGIKPPGIET